ncbi:golgin candidate 5 [Dorcoceras hygrometricum]|uniref:Golgin candidate 5 n=1 Tax=Dorcoceras hygrometricum TaxID=472368 RepID=A0A2Z7DF88_9LAMI|nr:golgin candidate 5 [Dorcoceras hygrometricum]
MGFMGQKGAESSAASLEQPDSLKSTSPLKDTEDEDDGSANNSTEVASEEIKKAGVDAEPGEELNYSSKVQKDNAEAGQDEEEVVSHTSFVEASEQNPQDLQTECPSNFQEKERSGEESSSSLESEQPAATIPIDQVERAVSVPKMEDDTQLPERVDEQKVQDDAEVSSAQVQDMPPEGLIEPRELSASDSPVNTRDAGDDSGDNLTILQHPDAKESEAAFEAIAEPIELKQNLMADTDVKEHLSTGSNSSDVTNSVAELEKLKKEMKMMETALQGAARQAQAKADEIAKLMNENEQLKTLVDDFRRKTNEAEIESLREEYHQRVAALERKVYALTKERDTLRREQNKKSDAAALLKEKDEIITQVMAEGEELSKKQAAQESQIRKLRAQIRELEEEKKGLLTKLQVEENKVESMKRDKAETEKLLQETVEKHQTELATQKEYYTDALNAAKEAEALAEARVNTEARTELESRLREAEDRESMLVQTLEELRQTLSRKEQQEVFREDILRRDIEDLQKRYQASERRCEELVTQIPESTRPLLRQIEAMQETAARRAEAWTAVERSLNSRLQEAEAKAAAAEEKERSINERLTQTLSRINVLDAQLSCLRAEQTQLTRSLEKERQRAAENRQEYLALKEESDTREGRVKQLEEEIGELRRKHKDDLHEALMHQEFLQKELEREKATRLEQERTARLPSSVLPDQIPIARQKSAAFENGNLSRKISSASSLSSMEESYFLQSTLDSSENFPEHRSAIEGTMSPYYLKSVTSSTFESALRQKEGELASYMSRLASMESIRDSLAEELVKMTAQCEKLQAESAALPGIRAELEALRRRHSAALELMGERDEELEELRADIADVKEMYREQVNLLVNKLKKSIPFADSNSGFICWCRLIYGVLLQLKWPLYTSNKKFSKLEKLSAMGRVPNPAGFAEPQGDRQQETPPMPGYPRAYQTSIGFPWSTQLFDCHLDQTNAIITAFLPCVTFGQIAEVLDEGELTCSMGTFIYLLMMPALCSQWLMGSKYRNKLRTRYNLVEAPYQDAISHFFCAYCSLCQEYRELKIRGLDPSQGWNGIRAQMEMQHRNQTMNNPPPVQNMST